MTPHDFLSIGECMVEVAPADSADRYQLGYAGDTFNTAWYMARIRPDWDVAYYTGAGQDAVSDRFVGFVASAGINTRHIARDADRTLGLYLISLDAGERSFSYWRGQSAARGLADDAVRLAAAIRSSKVVYLSGITLAILSPAGRATLLDALAQARSAGVRVAFDPNLRPRLWPDTATMCAAIMQAAAVCDIALPSYDDEAAFFGDATPADTRNRYAMAGATTVVVKNGAGPILFTAPERSGQVEITPVANVVDSTAAGDSFNAGFLSHFLTGLPLAESLAAGSALAASVIAGRGALVDV